MAIVLQYDRQGNDGGWHVKTALPGSADLARLMGGSTALLGMADRLEPLAGNFRMRPDAGEAWLLAINLHTRLAHHLDQEAAVLRTVATLDAEFREDVIDRTRAEHVALRRLVAPVIRGLRSIGQYRVPTRPGAFMIATAVFCEFVRLHVAYKREALYPLLSQFEDRGSGSTWYPGPDGRSAADRGRIRRGASPKPG